jgi:outer membrane protein assembly factor BamE (lipoprotein component of BamABCDE complex)
MGFKVHTAKSVLAAGVLFAGLGLGACSPQYQNHGYVPPQEDLDQINIGVDSKETVQATIGVPASSGVLENSGYYYVRSRQRALGFFAPQEVEREVVAVSFDDRGIVQNVERFGLERGNVVTLSRRVTSSATANKSFIRQLLGNLGRFDPSSIFGQ